MNHEQEEICLKVADVDQGMVDVLYWFNSFRSIITIYSCEGGTDEEGHYNEPYILFNCNSMADLTDLLYCLDRYSIATVRVEYYEGKSSFSPIRYSVRWKDISMFKSFVKVIQEGTI